MSERHPSMTTIAFDFDGTLAEEIKWGGPLLFGEPKPEALELLQEAIDHGFTVMIHTCRVNRDFRRASPDGKPVPVRAVIAAIGAFLRENGIRGEVSFWTHAGKPNASLFIEDRAINPKTVDMAYVLHVFGILASQCTQCTLGDEPANGTTRSGV